MPLIFQHRIYRRDLQLNPEVFYVFGDNLLRKGLGGQAKEMRGEPNAIGIATKKAPHNGADAFMTDDELEENKKVLQQDFSEVFRRLAQGDIVVWPADGIGTGLAALHTRAPKTFQVTQSLMRELVELSYGEQG